MPDSLDFFNKIHDYLCLNLILTLEINKMGLNKVLSSVPINIFF